MKKIYKLLMMFGLVLSVITMNLFAETVIIPKTGSLKVIKQIKKVEWSTDNIQSAVKSEKKVNYKLTTTNGEIYLNVNKYMHLDDITINKVDAFLYDAYGANEQPVLRSKKVVMRS